jgi:hypothetical protein
VKEYKLSVTAILSEVPKDEPGMACLYTVAFDNTIRKIFISHDPTKCDAQ